MTCFRFDLECEGARGPGRPMVTWTVRHSLKQAVRLESVLDQGNQGKGPRRRLLGLGPGG